MVCFRGSGRRFCFGRGSDVSRKFWTSVVQGEQMNKKVDLTPINQSRTCGKGVALSLFPSDSLSFESYEQFVRKSKKSKNDCFLAIFGLILAMFLTSQPYDFDVIAHIGL